MEDFVKRLTAERTELDDKRIKLDAFLKTEKYESLDPQMKILMAQQSAHMSGYADVLAKRIYLLTQEK